MIAQTNGNRAIEIQTRSTAEGGGITHVSIAEATRCYANRMRKIFVTVHLPGSSVPAVAFIFQNDKIFRPGGVENKVGNCIPSRSETRIVQFAFQILSIFSKYYFVTRTGRVRLWRHRG
ncbi:hypothetical protein AYO50_01235 [Acidobacteria bacterium SCGC AG-212-P17]|nr:hypothetical protein AYO50_01235 [Acidobacteria bacterium SCGC AG-212-P17]